MGQPKISVPQFP